MARTMAHAFNEWMRRYTEEPERFEREFRSVEQFKHEESEGKEPTYGETCAAYLQELMVEPQESVAEGLAAGQVVVAQAEEHLPCKQAVLGSIPSGGSGVCGVPAHARPISRDVAGVATVATRGVEYPGEQSVTAWRDTRTYAVRCDFPGKVTSLLSWVSPMPGR